MSVKDIELKIKMLVEEKTDLEREIGKLQHQKHMELEHSNAKSRDGVVAPTPQHTNKTMTFAEYNKEQRPMDFIEYIRSDKAGKNEP